MKGLLISLITLSLLTFAADGYSKPRIIKGTVYGKNGKEARGIIVTADKSNDRYYTSFDGTYEIKAKSNSKWLKFKFPDEEIKFSIEGIRRDFIDFKFPALTKNGYYSPAKEVRTREIKTSDNKMQELIKNRFFTLLFTIGFFVFIVSCQSKVSSDLPPALIEKKSIPILDVVNFESTFIDSGVVRYHLTAPKLLQFPEQRDQKKEEYMEFPQGFHLQKYNPDKTIESEMSANYGKNYVRQKLYYASGNVVMINAKGDTLRTEELNYDINKDLIYTDRFVSIKQGDQDITGTGGFRSDAQMTNWAFKKTQGHIYMEEE